MRSTTRRGGNARRRAGGGNSGCGAGLRAGRRVEAVEAVEGRILLSSYTLSSISLGPPSPISPVAVDAAGDVFGTTQYGGPSHDGTVYEVAAGTHTLTTLVSFDGANGARPAGVTLDAAGDLFGTTVNGGAANDGTVFEVAAGSTSLTTLAAFNGVGGAHPYGGITLDTSGNLFGTTQGGGAYSRGTVFEVAAGSHAVTTLASFGGAGGEQPYEGVAVDPTGNVFGTTDYGGASGYGTVFEVAAGSRTITELASFDETVGYQPFGVTLDASGNLFGTTRYGGTGKDGTAFELARGTNAIITLFNFSSDTGQPSSALTTDAAGNLFGTTSHSPSATGTAYEIAAGSATPTVLLAFSGASKDSGTSPSGVIVDARGNLFGTTNGGGTSGVGTVYESASATNIVTTLASFSGSNAESPTGGVTLDAAGDIFGTTYVGGANGSAAVYEIAAGSTAVTTVASFDGIVRPNAGLAIDAAGDLFGTTQLGGAANEGAVFEVAAGSRTITTVASFTGANGAVPLAGVTRDAAGNLFGTTDSGTAYEVAAGTGTITTLADFNGTDQPYPDNSLAIDAAGNLFGATSRGAVYEIADGTNTVTILVRFNGTNGSTPLGSVTLDAAGNLFGTTSRGGASGDGTVYEIAASTNTLTTLASFNGTNGEYPDASVTIDSGGNLFGTTSGGGANNSGTVYEIAAGSTTITTLASVSGVDLVRSAPLAIDARGDLFGSTERGGNDYSIGLAAPGTVFELSPVPPVPAAPEVVSVTPQDPAGNGKAAGAAGGGQRSVVSRIQVVFSQPVKPTAGAFGLGLVNQYGSGTDDGSADTDVSSVLGTPLNPSGDGVTWIIPIVQGGTNVTYSYALGAAGGGGAGLQDGVYRLSVSASAVTSSTGGATMVSSYSSPLFHRLLGDTDGNKTVNALDYARFKNAFGASSGSAAYNADLDFDGNGTLNALDYAQFKKRFGKSFTY